MLSVRLVFFRWPLTTGFLMTRLIAVEHDLFLGPLDDQMKGLLASLEIDTARFYLDRGTLDALQVHVLDEIAESLKADLRAQIGQVEFVGLRQIAARIPLLPQELAAAEQTDDLTKAFEERLANLDGGLAHQIAGVVFGTAAASDFEMMPLETRIETLEAVVRALPQEDLWTVRYDFTQLSMAWASSLLSPAYMQATHPLPITDETHVKALAVARAICGTAIRALLVTAPKNQLRKALRAFVENIPSDELLRLFPPVEPPSERQPALQAILERLLEKNGATEVVRVSEACTHVLHVEVIAGQNLVIRDLLSSDPYCRVTVSDRTSGTTETLRSLTIPRSLEPRWEARFHFPVGRRGATLRIEVLDEDAFSADDPMGDVHVDVGELPMGRVVEQWYPLLNVKQGEVRLRLRLSRLSPFEL
ncbi:MAG: hypothetical protein AUK47_16250 [Deltaproteobacteria bacterium CG2_30_63_29]|nr:MAG: hypothetical protein AUK47_16250 [Deltaproteobacteria bacterium CG2_30_63_29]